MTTQQRPVTMLIAALGGEGGGVLTNWIMAAAANLDLPAQSTSIPGVAQRTGGTTYYIEIYPTSWRELGPRRPVLALAPGIGDIDVLVSSEFMEAGRCIAGGFCTPDRTLLISSTSRFYVINEKMAMGDGRFDEARLLDVAEKNARARILFDMEQVAKEAGAMINAVMLGAIAGCGKLPIPAEEFERAIRAEGKAAEANLRGFKAGLAAARTETTALRRPPEAKRREKPRNDLATLERDIRETMPQAAQDVVIEGVRRLARFQDDDYARLFLDRLEPIRDLEAQVHGDGKLLRETARHLAVRMSFEDLIRVAQAKIDPARMERIEQELGAKPGEPYSVTEFLKPGIEEMCQVLPPSLARRIIAYSEKRGWLDTVHVGMYVKTTSVSGYLRFRLLAKLRPLRRFMHRYVEEQAQIESWLAMVTDAALLSPALALEVAECARLIKGYGSTHKRGTQNFQTIETRLIRPALQGQIPVQDAIDGIASARTAALLDPEGNSLAKCLDEFDARQSFRIAAE
jgi:indolepyruvate ferredoxin oxidoreductase beta subunit